MNIQLVQLVIGDMLPTSEFTHGAAKHDAPTSPAEATAAMWTKDPPGMVHSLVLSES